MDHLSFVVSDSSLICFAFFYIFYIFFFIEIQTLNIKQASNSGNLPRPPPPPNTHTEFQWLVKKERERERVVLYSKHKRSASVNGCVSCLSSWSEAAMQYFSITALCFNEWMKMLTFGFPFYNFDLKIWNFAIKIIRSNLLSVCTFWSRPNRIRGIFSSTFMSLLISALTSDQKDCTAGHSQNK